MEGRIVAITGGASGIGLAVAKLLASRGAKVSIADVQDDLLAQVPDVISKHLAENSKEKTSSFNANESILTTKCDVRDLSQVTAWLQATVEKFGRVDHVANVAGVWRGEGIEDHDEEVWDFVIGVNLTVRFIYLKAPQRSSRGISH